jgi:hypothetical protein
MRLKVGDLVQDPQEPSNIWLVIGYKGFDGFVRVQNISTGYTCQYNSALLQHFKSDKK